MRDSKGNAKPTIKNYRYNKTFRITKAVIGIFFLIGLGIVGSRAHNKSTKAVIEAVIYIFVILSGLVLMKRPKPRDLRSHNQKLPQDSDKS